MAKLKSPKRTSSGTTAVAARSPADMRLLSAIANRLAFSQGEHGVSFDGKRDLYVAAGYDRDLTPAKFWNKYRRNGVARRLVNILPNATWRAGAELIEDDDPDVVTPFEEAWISLNARLNVWDRLRKTDILAQLGRYSVLLIGGPGALQTPIGRMKDQDQIAYLRQRSEKDVEIKNEDVVSTSTDPRYGQPNLYTFKRMNTPSGIKDVKVHWTRVIHVADEAIDDDLLGDPRLATVWNWLDDLEKVAASGSEAFWQRVRPILAAKIMPGVTIPDETAVEEEIDSLLHGLRRWARLSGIDLEEVGSTEVAGFDKPIDALIKLIVAGYGIPNRIFSGSERGELASTQDRDSWEQQVSDRRSQFAESVIVRPFVTRLIELGALLKPDEYEVRWPDVRDMNMADRLGLAKTAAEANAAQGETIMTSGEIRDQILGLYPLKEDEVQPIGQSREQLLRRLRIAKVAKIDAAQTA